jgi:hypothetical protein
MKESSAQNSKRGRNEEGERERESCCCAALHRSRTPLHLLCVRAPIRAGATLVFRIIIER